MRRERIKDLLEKLPHSPGIYMFKDEKGKILYVGKAKNLKKRVASYFRKGRPLDARLHLLVNQVHDIDLMTTSSEAEALIYEAGLIKDHRPEFNIDLKDDKSYPFLKLTLNEDYPRIMITRRKLNDGAVYYGPYVNTGLLKEAMSFMKKIFPLRSCRKLRKKTCLEYHIGQCFGPCEGIISKNEYGKTVLQLKAFLEGRKNDLITSLEEEMKYFSENKEYEKALSIKKKIEALTSVKDLHNSSKVPIFGELEELQNVLGLSKEPMIIECFDISNTFGGQSVGAMVRFSGGKPDREGYRKFKIREIKGIDDYSMIREVVRRRYQRLVEEKSKLPDLVLIDGGKGHLSVASKELEKLGLYKINIASIAKEFNHIYIKGRRNPVRLSPGSRVLLLIQRIRDEAHRFAITYHRQLRGKDFFNTTLRDVKGIGPVNQRRLLEYFQTIDNIKQASIADLKQSGLNQKTAEVLFKHLKENRDS